MPVISMFYGVIVMMYYFDNRQHQLPHIHIKYGDEEAVIEIPGGEIIEGSLRSSALHKNCRKKKIRIVSAVKSQCSLCSKNLIKHREH